ncbi:MAG: CHASE3 domain-containing protein [Polyangiaceae bacterium]
MQLLRMTEDAGWVERTDEIVGLINDTTKRIIEQEAGLRGYLITEDRRFLESFDRANPKERFAHLRTLVTDSEERARLIEAERRYDRWFSAAELAGRSEGLTLSRSAPSMLDRTILMDGVREMLAAALKTEEDLRRARVAASFESTRNTKFLLVGMVGLAAIALSFLSRKQLLSITDTYGKALGAEKKTRIAMEDEAWVRTGQAEIAVALQGDRTVEDLGSRCLGALASYVDADVGAFFTQDAGRWKRRAGFALDMRTAGLDHFALG